MIFDGQYDAGDRRIALNAEVADLRLVAHGIARTLTGSTDRYCESVQHTVEDALRTAVFGAYLPTRAQWEQDIAEDEAFDRGKQAA